MNTVFGDWINNIDTLNADFLSGQPFEHIVIDNFFNNTYISNQ